MADIASQKGSKRGYGSCEVCNKEYLNRRKPKNCDCGFELGGSFEARDTVPKNRSIKSVLVYERTCGTLMSVQVTPNDDREFAFIADGKKICYAKKCLSLRGSFAAGNIKDFSCHHLKLTPQLPVYATKFVQEEINSFTPDTSMQEKMKYLQQEDYPTVVKTSPKTYAVIAETSSGNPMGYTHVSVCRKGETLKCNSESCKKKYGRTKQVYKNQGQSGVKIAGWLENSKGPV